MPKQKITRMNCVRARPTGSLCVSRRSPRIVDSALASSRIMSKISGEEAMKRVEHRLEEVRFPSPEPGKGALRSPQEGPQHPGHLRSDQAKHDHPDTEDG